MLQRLLKLCFAAAVVVSASTIGHAQIDTHEVGDMGYLSTPMESAEGIVLTNNRRSEIYALNGNTLKPILQGRNCGLYTNMSKDGKFIGFKSFNENDEQAPAIVNIATGEVTLLENYSHECGQVSFSDDGTMAYTVGSNLIVRKGLTRRIFNLGFYTNIANISPDGKYVAYSSIEGEMFMINLDTKAIESIAVADGYQPIWSPDGQKIAIHVTNGTISVFDRPSMRVHNIGEGQSVSWANNSKELIFTKIDRKNEFEVMGSSIKKVNFDGTEECTLVASSDNMPSGAILTKDNNLIVPYKTGIKRGLSLIKMPDEITPASLSSSSLNEISIISFGEDKLVGARLQDPCENPNYKNTQISTSFEQKIGAMDIPYLSQIYDVPAVSGCTKYGYVACAPTTASMYLGYYGLLDKVAVATRQTNVSTGAYTYYAHHVGKSYTNQKGTYTFSQTAYGNGCSGVQGGYGYMWYGNYSPRDRFTSYMTLNGCTSSAMQWSASASWTKFKSESTAGRPTMLCIALRSSGHLILGFATNCKYRSASGFTQQIGSFVCHDPYGDCNDSTWGDNDGQHSTYDWIGYNNGQENIDVFYYSCTAVPPTSSVTPVEKKITASKTAVTLEAEYGAATQPYTDVTIKGENLTSAMSVASNSGVIVVTKQSDWNDLTGGTLRLTLNTNYSLGAGERNGHVAVQSGPTSDNLRVEIDFTAILNASTSTNPDTPSTNPDTPLGDDNLKSNKSSFTLTGVFNDTSNVPYVDLTITGNNLTSGISTNPSSSIVIATKQSDWNDLTGGTLRVTLNTQYQQGAGTKSGFVAVVSGTHRIEVQFTATLTESTTTDPGETPETPETPVINDNITSMKEVWNYSGATKNWMSLESPMTRFIAYNDGKLYALNCSPYNTTLSINIIDAYTGADTGSDVNLEGVSGGLNLISSIRFVDGKLVGANTAAANNTFTVYYWKDGVSSAPTKILEDATHGGLTMGSNIAISGNMTNGRIWATDDGCKNVLYYTITNGTVSPTPTVLALTDASGAALSLLGSRGASEVIPNADGTFWVDGQSAYPILFDATGKQTGTMQAGVFNNNTRGTALKVFNFGSKRYAAAVAYSGTSQTNGYFTLTDITSSQQEATNYICKYPEAGLGATANGQNMSSICQSTRENGTILDIWVCCVQQGVAHYTYDGCSSSGIEDINVSVEEDEAPAVYYNLQGVPVVNPESGIYIRVQGGKATKVLIR